MLLGTEQTVEAIINYNSEKGVGETYTSSFFVRAKFTKYIMRDVQEVLYAMHRTKVVQTVYKRNRQKKLYTKDDNGYDV